MKMKQIVLKLRQPKRHVAQVASRDSYSIFRDMQQNTDSIVFLLHDPGMMVVLQVVGMAFIEVGPVLQQHWQDLPRQGLARTFAVPVILLKCSQVRFLTSSSWHGNLDSCRFTFRLEFIERLQSLVPCE